MAEINIRFPFSRLGGGLPGFQARGGLLGGGAGVKGGTGMVGGQARGLTRIVLRRAFGKYNYLEGAGILREKSGLTPFRQVAIAGDPKQQFFPSALKQDPRLPAINQVNGIGPTMLNVNGGGVKVQQGGSTWSGNPKYVYDSSTYIKYKNNIAQQKVYNDKSFGGDDSNGSYVALMRVRR